MPGNDQEFRQKQRLYSSPAPADTISDPRAKRLFGVVSVIAVVAIIFGVVRLYHSLQEPFAGKVSLANLNLSPEQVESIEQLKERDTDNDTLSDYDELYRYNTSPYLSDSDSDGANDAEEIAANSDPNCPSGKDCSAFGSGTAANSNTSGAALSAEELRRTLEAAGAPQYILNNTSDADLLALYQQLVAEQGTPSQDNVNIATTNTGVVDPDVLKNLTAADIRELLRSSGVDEETLTGLDDETLVSVFLEAINEQFSSQ